MQQISSLCTSNYPRVISGKQSVRSGIRIGLAIALAAVLGFIPVFGAAQESSNPTDIKSALGLSGENASPSVNTQENLAPKIARSKTISSHSESGWREKWLKKWRADHERKAAKEKPDMSAAPHVAHPTRGTLSGSPLSESKKHTANIIKAKRLKARMSLAAESKKHTANIIKAKRLKARMFLASDAKKAAKKHEHSQKLVTAHKTKASKTVLAHFTTKKHDARSKQRIAHLTKDPELKPVHAVSIKSSKSALKTVTPKKKSQPGLPGRPRQEKALISASSKTDAAAPPLVKNSANTITPIPPSLYGQTKPDGFGASAESMKDHTQNSPIGAVNDSGRMIFYLIPTLAVLMLTLHLLRKFMEKSGRISRTDLQNGSARNSLRQWNYPREKKAGLLRMLLTRMQTTPDTKRAGNIHVIESIPLGNTHIHLVEVRGRTLLLGANAAGVNLLTELEADEIDDIQDSFHSQLQAASADLDVLDLAHTETPLQSMVATLEDVMRETREAVSSRTRRLRTLREDEDFIV